MGVTAPLLPQPKWWESTATSAVWRELVWQVARVWTFVDDFTPLTTAMVDVCPCKFLEDAHFSCAWMASGGIH